MVLTPDEASDVDYALSFDTKPGGTAATAGLTDGRAVIAKTGTTNLSQSAFFIGAIPQFSLAVGLFTNQQGCPQKVAGCVAAANQESAPPAGVQTLYGLAGLQGYGGQEPATIWHNFMEKEFLDTTPQAVPDPGLRRLDLEPARPERAQAAQAPQPAQHLPGGCVLPPLLRQRRGGGNGNGNGNGEPEPQPDHPGPDHPGQHAAHPGSQPDGLQAGLARSPAPRPGDNRRRD